MMMMRRHNNIHQGYPTADNWTTILLPSVIFLFLTRSWYVTAELHRNRGGLGGGMMKGSDSDTWGREILFAGGNNKQGGDDSNFIVFNLKNGGDLGTLQSSASLQNDDSSIKTFGESNDNAGNNIISTSTIIHHKRRNIMISDSNEYRDPFNVSHPPNETNVTTPQSLPFEFEIDLFVKDDAITNDLLQNLAAGLAKYIERKFKELVALCTIFVEGCSFDSKKLELRHVDLSLSLLNVKWRDNRRLRYSFLTSSIVNPQLRSRRVIQSDQKDPSKIKVMTINVNGLVQYSIMEMDDSILTPASVEKEWNAAYVDIVSQRQLEQAIDDMAIKGVVKLERVMMKQNSNGQTKNIWSDNTADIMAYNAVSESITQNEDISNLYNDDRSNNNNNNDEEKNIVSEIQTEDNNSDTKKGSSGLERPSTLSIIFGFILTAIAIMSLIAYAYIFYRKRQKRLRKKKKMQDSITFPPAILPKQSPNYQCKMSPNAQSVSASRSSPRRSKTMILSRAQSSHSEETSYKGLESSIGSEDISDLFANELKLAASLDQQAWDEFQRKKEALEDSKIGSELKLGTSTSRRFGNSRKEQTMPSLLSKNLAGSENEAETEAIETELRTSPFVGKSFPYGDEIEEYVDDSLADQIEMSPKSRSIPGLQPLASLQPRHSVLSQASSLWEEKKDETSPADCFSEELRNKIERDTAESDSTSLSTSDIVSEVSELSRYVKRYGRRKDRKNKRDGYIHDRSNFEGTQSSLTNAHKAMSIGMDGRVYEPEQRRNDFSEADKYSSRMMAPPSSPEGQTRGLHPDLPFDEASNTDDNEDNSIRTQRLGISPYKASNYPKSQYNNSSSHVEDDSSSNREPTISSRDESRDNYYDAVGRGQNNASGPQDRSRSSSSRLSRLRSNDAIIDSSTSDVNLALPSDHLTFGGTAPLNLKRYNKNKNSAAVVSAATSHLNHKPTAKSNYTFDRLRGLFEQKTNKQPAPIYPPDEHWQNSGSLGHKH